MIIICKAASKLISESMERPLTSYEKLKVSLHLFLCRYVGGRDCEKYRAQIEFLHRAAAQAAGKFQSSAEIEKQKLSPVEKKRIQKIIRGAGQDRGRRSR